MGRGPKEFCCMRVQDQALSSVQEILNSVFFDGILDQMKGEELN